MSISKKTYIIAEAGVNHGGSVEKAFQLVDVAIAAGADAVKFQTFKSEKVATFLAEKAQYQKNITGNVESQQEMLRQLELPYDAHHDLQKYCMGKKINFLSTAFDAESLYFLNNDLRLNILKIPSGEITNGPLLLAFAKTNKKLILSTGMTTLSEIEQALSVIAFGLLNNGTKPGWKNFHRAYASEEGQHQLAQCVTLLHCTTAYPTNPESVNLRAMHTMQSAFGLPVGYSDHTLGVTIPIAAVAQGACMIEKHFTLDRNLLGPDHQASLDPDELAQMVKEIRIVEAALGNGRKVPVPEEYENLSVARKSLVALKDIDQGNDFDADSLGALRPGTGISPMYYWDYLNKPSKKALTKGELIEP